MMTSIGNTPLVEADSARPKWASQVDPQRSRLDDLTSLNFSVLRLWGFIAVVEAAAGYAVNEYVIRKFGVCEVIKSLPGYTSIAAWVGLSLVALVLVVILGLATFAAYMYTLARMRTPATGEPTKFLTFHKKSLEAKWAGKPIPVEVIFTWLMSALGLNFFDVALFPPSDDVRALLRERFGVQA
jgi:hypothetical protein